jgi:glucose/arabinose dehydrogenase
MPSTKISSFFALHGFVVLALVLAFARTGVASEVPDGFEVTQVATGMTSVTRMELLPDGRILVLEQGGNIRVIENGVLRPTPFLTVDADSFSEHGLLGIALDPAFATNHFFYVYYTAKTPVLHNRVSRFIAGESADPASEVVVFELDELHGELGWHQGGNLRFGPDGKLYIAVGDDRNGANAQTTDNLFGKILRINSDGSIPTDNPFYQSLTGKNRAIWALGLRNPYSFAFSKTDGIRMLINDVGEDTWEEINHGVAAANYGWPETEGFTSDPRFKSPLVEYGHGYDSDDLGCAITGGVFYQPTTTQFPTQYQNKYFYADFCAGWIRSLDLTDLSSTVFARFTYYPVDLKVAEDGTLYYLERGIDSNTDGAVFKIEYTKSEAPHITTQPSNVTVAQGQPASFTVSATGASPLNYQWQRNGVDLAGENSATLNLASTQLSDNGATFVCVVSNGFGSVSSQPAQLTVIAGSAPVANITSPAVDMTYRGGDVIQYSGTGTDADDGNLPASAFTWQVDFHHDTHTHPFLPAFSGTTAGQFTIPTTGETATDVWYRIYLTVRDSSGLTHTTFRDITPVVETIDLATNPAGLKIKVDDQPQNTPESISTVVGVTRTLSAISPQLLNGQSYEFESWSDGGAATHTVNQGGTFVANYRLATTQSNNIVLYAAEGLRVGNYVVVSDATAAGGSRLDNPDAGAAKLSNPLANPGTYVELQFTAQAGVGYRLWIRGKAQADNPFNDSIFVQFNDSVDDQGVAKSRIGSTSAEVINLEDCFACGLSGWGWQDNGWGAGELGPLVYFANSGVHTLRIQVREDGLSLDQIVLSPEAYLTTAPGALTNDNTILAKNDGSGGGVPAPAPTVTSVSPTSGSTSGGTSISISGNGFSPGASVLLGGVAATNVTVVNSNTITATTAAHASGAVNVVVTNSDNQSGTLVNGFTYTSPPAGAPTVSAVNPGSGPTSGGTAVTISGTGFVSGATVKFGAVAAVNVQVVNSTSLTATTPAQATAGAVNVTVTNPDNQSGTLVNGFTYTSPPPGPPTVSVVNPGSGPTSGGTAVTISGTGFVSGATVKFGAVAATNVQVVNSTSLTATTPAQATAGAVNVTVTNPDNQSGTLVNGFTYTTPPSSGPAEIVLYASQGFRVGNYIVVNDATAAGGARLDNPDAGAAKLSNAQANPGSYVELQFTAQAGVAYRLWIRGRAQNDNPFNDSIFVQFNDSVDVQGVVKSRIGSKNAEVINLEDCFACGLSGWGWQDNGWGAGELGPLVYFANSGVHTLRIQVREDGLSLDQIVLSPKTYLTNAPGALTNDNTILAKNDGSGGGVPAPAPTVTSISPTSGSTSGGTSISIGGNGFSPGASVLLGGVAATNVTVVNSNTITATTAAHASGAVNVVVTNSDNQSGTLVNGFTYTSPPPGAPTVSVVNPGSGPTSGGTAVTISGTGFVSGATVKFGAVAAVNVQVVNSTSLTATTPAQATAGAVNVTVTNPDNQSGTLVNGFTYTTPPSSGPAEIVLYASQGFRVGNYIVVNDATAAGGARLDNPDAGAAKLSNPLANPGTYVELQFTAQAGVGYRLWIRGKAQADSPYNDSIFVQFNDSVDGQGAVKSRIGSTSAEVINLEDCFACGLSGWGWQDNGWGVGELGPLVYFATTGVHTLRIQAREDGMSLDQIVLSPKTYLTKAPGAVTNDNTILTKTGSP